MSRTPPPLVDTHAHLTDPRFADDLPSVLDACRAAGVVQVLTVGTTATDSASAIALAAAHPGLFAAVGIHPNDAAKAAPGDFERIVALAEHPAVVAIGETGLDLYWKDTPFDQQLTNFGRHLDLARDRELPIIVHSRDCARELLGLLARQPRPIAGVLHSFTGTWDEAREALDLGLHLSFAGMITFANRSLDPLRSVASLVPSDRLLVETDSPYLTPHPHRGRRNDPSLAAVTAARLAELRGISLGDLAETTTSNARRLFRLHPDTAI